MFSRLTFALAGAAAGVCAAGGLWLWLAAPVPAPREADQLRWLPIENHEIFGALGARTWRLHVPAQQLVGKKRFRLKLTKDGRERDVGVGELWKTRKASDPLDVTVVLYWDAPTPQDIKRIRTLLWSREFGDERFIGNPVPGCDTFQRVGGIEDPAGGDGLRLCLLGRTHPDGKLGYAEEATFSLHLE